MANSLEVLETCLYVDDLAAAERFYADILGLVLVSRHLLERTYKWMHEHFPHIVDCQPIDVRRFVADAGFQLIQQSDLEIWTMPVAVVVGLKE